MKIQGNIIVSSIFVVLITASGAAIVTHSLLHSKIAAIRQKTWNGKEKVWSRLFLYLHLYRETLFASDMNQFTAPADQFFTALQFPDANEKEFLIHCLFHQYPLPSTPQLKKTRITSELTAVHRESNQTVSAQATVELLEGEIPVGQFPLFIHKQTKEGAAPFMLKRNVWIEPDFCPLLGSVEIQNDLERFLLDAFRFKGEPLSWEELRKKIGLEISPQPIPEGIYAVKEGEIIESLYIQGDIQKLILSSNGDRQQIDFVIQGQRYTFSYVPGQPDADGWEPALRGNFFFHEKIVINGNVWSLSQDGSGGLLPTSGLQILASGKIIIQTSLTTRNVQLKKINFSNLALISCSRDFLGKQLREAAIVIQADTDVEIRAAMISEGTFSNQGKRSTIHGSLFANDLENSGAITIHFSQTPLTSEGYLRTQPFKCLTHFCIPFIQENNDE